MSIKITTIIGDNYGSALQALALQQAFRNNGVHSYIIRVLPRSVLVQLIRTYIIPTKYETLFQKMRKANSDYRNRKKRRKVADFYKKHINVVTYKNKKELIDKERKTKVFVCGSDQIWNPRFQPSYLYYIDFPVDEEANIYSYAASIAVESLDRETRQYFSSMLHKYKKISVREKSGKELLESFLPQCIIRKDVDPVLLVGKDYWQQYTSERFRNKKYIFLYMLRPSDEMISYAIELGKQEKLPILYIGDFYYNRKEILSIHDASVEDFLSAIKYAEFILTNSFHATVFATLFHKRFSTYIIKGTGGRAKDFLEEIGLLECITDLKEPIAKKEYNWEKIDDIMLEKINDSKKYIQEISAVENGERKCI